MVQSECSQFGQHNGFLDRFETVSSEDAYAILCDRALLKYIDAGVTMPGDYPEQQQTTAHTKIGQDPR